MFIYSFQFLCRTHGAKTYSCETNTLKDALRRANEAAAHYFPGSTVVLTDRV